MGSIEAEEQAVRMSDIEQICKWNGPLLPSTNELLHRLIEKQTRSQPTAKAICSWDGELTYAELDGLASKLAVHLAGFGIGPDVVVPLCFQKSKYMIVAMVAVLKAGGAFCPMEPGQPRAITADIITRVGARLCLCSSTCADLMGSIAPDQTILVVDEASLDAISQQGKGNVNVPHGDNVAYVFFTSGSTGVPKGCINTHSACCISFKKQAEVMFVHSGSRLLHRASFCFDAFLCETIVGLVAGGCICIPQEKEFQENPTKAIADYQTNWALFLPSFLGQIDRASVPCLTTLVLGVEVMSDYHIAQWSKQAKILNAYGLTECAVVSTVASNIVPGSNPRNIGVPIGCHAWIVDADDSNRLVAIGSMGELTLSGPALGKGYLNDQKQTDEAYLPAPAWLPREYREVEPRIFRTGDLVRYDPDGSMTCIGRKANLSLYEGTPIIMHEVEYFLQSAMPSAAQFVAEIVNVPAIDESPVLISFVGFRQDRNGSIVQLTNEDSSKLSQITERNIPKDLKATSPYPDQCWPTVFVPCFPMPKKWSGKANRIQLREAAYALTHSQVAAFKRTWQTGLAFAPQPSSERQWLLDVRNAVPNVT